ncbi:MAG: hypothetical protein LBF32_04225 [Streptococcaceae bacterium]|nr:hypothetical protein [Streptococcaceae bacterium]
MKKLMLLVCVLGMGMFCCVGTVGNCVEISIPAKLSIFLPNDSWLIQEVGTKLQQANRVPVDGWQARIKVSFNCLERQGVSERIVDVNSVLNKTIVNLSIPMGERRNIGPAALSVVVKFDKPVANIDDAIRATNPPQDERNEIIPYEIKVMNIGSSGYERDINSMEGSADERFVDFLFNREDTKLFFVNLGTQSSGYILVDHDNHKLFWPCRDFYSFKKGQFAELNDVLRAYWGLIQQNNLCKRPHWI